MKQFQKLYDKAKSDGDTKVTVYWSSAASSESFFDAFEKRFPGIEVDAHTVKPGTTVSTLNAVLASGKASIDVVSTGSTEMVEAATDGDFLAYVPFTAEFEKGDNTKMDEHGYLNQIFYGVKGIMYNTSAIDKDEVPTSWKGLLDSKWKGKLGLRDPTHPGGGQELVAMMLWDGRYDLDYFKKLDAQGLKLLGSPAAAANSVATGQVDVGFPGNYNEIIPLQKKGAPIAFEFPVKGGNLLTPIYQAIVKNAPHVAAAKLFEAWCLTPEAVPILNELGNYSPLPSATKNAPKGLPEFGTLDLFKAVPLPKVQEVMTGSNAQLTKIFH